MQWEIKPYVSEKAEDFCAFLKQSWLDTYVSEIGRKATDSLIASMLSDGIRSLVPGRDETAYLLQNGASVVGSIICAERNRFLYVWGLYVAQE
nr:hypothetical protein [uncultured Cohaesibacter sp.]